MDCRDGGTEGRRDGEIEIQREIYGIQENALAAPEALRILAGGETTGAKCGWYSRPGRAPDRSFSLSPFQGWKSFGLQYPVVSPPANIRCPSGTKTEKLSLEIYTLYLSTIPSLYLFGPCGL